MSELIKKFRPPSIKWQDAERGVRYIESTQQKDQLGFDVNIGDIVCFPKGYMGTSDLLVGKVIGVYTKVTPPDERQLRRNPNTPTVEETKISVAYWKWQSYTRASISSNICIKLSEAQFNPEITDKLLTA